jgi:hypothetical protein
MWTIRSLARCLAVAVLATALAACATTERFQANLQNWVGQSEAALVNAWGPPADVIEAGGRRFIVYEAQRQYIDPGFPRRSWDYDDEYWRPWYPVGVPPRLVTLACAVFFESRGGIIVGWQHRGNACRA